MSTPFDKIYYIIFGSGSGIKGSYYSETAFLGQYPWLRSISRSSAKIPSQGRSIRGGSGGEGFLSGAVDPSWRGSVLGGCEMTLSERGLLRRDSRGPSENARTRGFSHSRFATIRFPKARVHFRLVLQCLRCVWDYTGTYGETYGWWFCIPNVWFQSVTATNEKPSLRCRKNGLWG